MKASRKLTMWGLLLCKRIYKKPTFIIVLLLIPLVVFGFNILAKEDSGFITVALAKESANDPLASEIIDNLADSSQLIRFLKCESPEGAERLVRTGKADGAWIFAENLQQSIEKFVETRDKDNAVVKVLEREATVPLMLAREKLSGALIESCSHIMYLNFTRENSPALNHLSDEQLMDYYNDITLNGTLFEFDYLNSDNSTTNPSNANYLLTPLRGLLAVLIVLCGLATAMYYMQDKKSGLFAWLSERRYPFVELGYQLISVINVSIAVVISLAIVKLSGGFLREMVILLLYALCVSVFCMLTRLICGNLKNLSIVTPVFIVAMIAICPVFFDFKNTRLLQLLFPPTYYVNALHNDKYLWFMVIYILVFWLLYRIIGKLKRA